FLPTCAAWWLAMVVHRSCWLPVSCYGDFRDLHSFPTRRSSDLAIDYLRFTGKSEEEVAVAEAFAKANHLYWTADSPEPLYTDVLDRKSTRLNSSHVKISYAVFCLKKKKTQQ